MSRLLWYFFPVLIEAVIIETAMAHDLMNYDELASPDTTCCSLHLSDCYFDDSKNDDGGCGSYDEDYEGVVVVEFVKGEC